MEELSEFYAAFAAGKQTQLPEPVLQFSDFARWQRRWSHQRCSNPTVRLLEEAPAERPRLYLSHQIIDVAGELAARVAQERFHVSNDLVARLNALGHSRGATLFMTLLAGFKTLLLAPKRTQRHLRGDHDGQPLSTGDGACDRPFREHHAHPHPIRC